jgi:hypothetical protein
LRRVHEAVRARIRKNPRVAPSKDPRVPRRCCNFRVDKSRSSTPNVTQNSARRPRPIELYRKFHSDPIFQFLFGMPEHCQSVRFTIQTSWRASAVSTGTPNAGINGVLFFLVRQSARCTRPGPIVI